MTNDYRTKHFKLGSIHGRSPTDGCREALLRNYIFGAGNLVIVQRGNTRINIRIVGYEIPIWSRGRNRDECIDLLGYDETFRPWIIELKKAASTEKLDEVFTQVDRYFKAFEEGIREAVQTEIQQRFLWPQFSFKAEAAGKVILADRSFFKRQKEDSYGRKDILRCSFARCKDEKTLLGMPRAEISLRVERV